MVSVRLGPDAYQFGGLVVMKHMDILQKQLLLLRYAGGVRYILSGRRSK